jgi:hypothetical protein
MLNFLSKGAIPGQFPLITTQERLYPDIKINILEEVRFYQYTVK